MKKKNKIKNSRQKRKVSKKKEIIKMKICKKK